MSDPGLALQGAIDAALKSAPSVTALVADRSFDRVPASAAFPHIEYGEIQVVDDGADCLEWAVEVYATIHVWSRAVGKVEAQQIAGAVRDTLHNAALTLATGWALVEIVHRDTRIFIDADGLTTHGVVTFRALIDPAS